jgi:hypothetical protein
MSHGPIHPDTPNADAQSWPDMAVIAATLVTMRVPRAHAIEHPHDASTTAAPNEDLRAIRFCMCAFSWIIRWFASNSSILAPAALPGQTQALRLFPKFGAPS